MPWKLVNILLVKKKIMQKMDNLCRFWRPKQDMSKDYLTLPNINKTIDSTLGYGPQAFEVLKTHISYNVCFIPNYA